MTTANVGGDIFQRRVLEAREAIGLSLKDAARLLGFKNYQTLSAIEKGKRKRINILNNSDGRRVISYFCVYFLIDLFCDVLVEFVS